MERGILISGARCGTNRLEPDGPVSNGFGAMSPETCRYTMGAGNSFHPTGPGQKCKYRRVWLQFGLCMCVKII